MAKLTRRVRSYRAEVTIQEPIAGSTDSYGESVNSWSTGFATCYAEVLPQSGREFYQAAQVHADMTDMLRMHYLAGVTTQMRVKLGSRYLNIIAVRNLEERDRELELLCVEEC